ncbi:MAG: CPBP family intramembrane glutamic endopeptidase [Usitatibacteraceae bacterium]
MTDSTPILLAALVVVPLLLMGFPLAQRQLAGAMAKFAASSPLPAWHPVIVFCFFCSILLASHAIAIGACMLWVTSCKFDIVLRGSSPFDISVHAANSVLAAFFEEAIFRGFLLAFLLRFVSAVAALRIQALLFAVVHPLTVSGLSFLSIVPYYFLGLGFGYLAVRDTTLIRSCAAHLGFNVCLVVLSTTALPGTVPNSLFTLEIGPFALLLGAAYWLTTTIAMVVFVYIERKRCRELEPEMGRSSAQETRSASKEMQ